ncbi:fibronectin type III domain-containing protein [Paenibacillus xanthanilyticus]|uniref:Fibronectin type III domain-containing protein n=1 Tax=Paenibacillus xanthanilyticus TaxID=1783531 RepID=A0ABV8K1W5_9BACL
MKTRLKRQIALLPLLAMMIPQYAFAEEPGYTATDIKVAEVAANGQILDVDMGTHRILYYDPTARQLAIQNMSTGQVTVNPSVFPTNASTPSGHLTVDGAAYVKQGSLEVWTNKGVLDLGYRNNCNAIERDYVTYCSSYGDSEKLVRRHLASGQETTVKWFDPYEDYLGDVDVRNDGSVVYSYRQGYASSIYNYNSLYLFQDGKTILLHGQDGLYNYQGYFNDKGVAFVKQDGFDDDIEEEDALYFRETTASGSIKWLSSGGEYTGIHGHNNDIVYTRTGDNGISQVYLFASRLGGAISNDPSGAVSLGAISDDGDVAYQVKGASRFSISHVWNGQRVAYSAGLSGAKPFWQNGVWYSSHGNTVYKHVPPQELTVPIWLNGSLLRASEIDSTSALLSWDAAVDAIGVTGYRIYKQGQLLAELPAGTTSYSLTGLQLGEKALYKVEAGNAAGNWSSDGPSVEFVTSPRDLAKPTWPAGSKATSGGTTTAIALISWTPAVDNVGVTGYRIMNGTNVVAETDGNTRTKGITGLNTNRTYTFKVEARDAAGNWSTDGPSVTVTTLPVGGDLTAPTWEEGSQVTAGSTTSTSTTLSWSGATDNVNVTRFRIMNETAVLVEVLANPRTAVIEGLAPGTTYTLHVEAGDEAGHWSADGPSVTITTLQ